MCLRELYRLLEFPGDNPLKQAHARLDAAVVDAYGFDSSVSVLEHLFRLNAAVAKKEAANEAVQAPGIPDGIERDAALLSEGCFGGF